MVVKYEIIIGATMSSTSNKPKKHGYIKALCVSLVSVSVSFAALNQSLGNNGNEHSANLDLKQFERPSYIEFPENAPYSPQVATLGKMLFFDPRLSGPQNMSCATCHNPSFGWETPVARAIGANNMPLSRHAPTVLNLAEEKQLFWDGRAKSLEEQAIGPITHPNEMASSFPIIVERLKKIGKYRTWFERLYPGQGISKNTILTAIATYERTLQSGWAPFDAWIAGEADAISASAKRGFELFTGKAGCSNCHTGWNFTDHKLHDIGLDTEDTGATSEGKATFAFKTPGLRNITLRAPYMHTGELNDLKEVINHYIDGGIERETKSMMISGFDASTREREDLLAFLKTLSEDYPDITTPSLPSDRM